MAKVYCIEAGDYDDHMVVGVALNLTDAKVTLERFNKSPGGRWIGSGSIEIYDTEKIYGEEGWWE